LTGLRSTAENTHSGYRSVDFRSLGERRLSDERRPYDQRIAVDGYDRRSPERGDRVDGEERRRKLDRSMKADVSGTKYHAGWYP